MNIPQLRPYQSEALSATRQALLSHRRAILHADTGAGKTTIAAAIISSAVAKGNRVNFIAHRKELVDQAFDRLACFGIHAGKIMAGKASCKQVTISSIASLAKRELPPAHIVIVDECHHGVSASYQRVLQQYEQQGAYILGLTATPWRLDNKPLGDLFKVIVPTIPMQQLIDQGFLVPPRYYVPTHIDLNGVHSSKGDFKAGELFKKYDTSQMYDGVIDNYSRYASGKRTIVFCVNVNHANATAERFNQVGIKAGVVTGTMSKSARESMLSAFASGQVQVLCNVNILTEGYDLPAIECVILNRATKSLTLYMQMIGRGLRSMPGKTECIVIDHGDNVERHLPVEVERSWSLEKAISIKKSAGKGVPAMKLCPECEALCHVGLTKCHYCGAELKKAKELKQVEFKELRAENYKMANRPEDLKKPLSQMSYVELQKFAALQGYKKGWAWHKYQFYQNQSSKSKSPEIKWAAQ